jgi:hypothetical protein
VSAVVSSNANGTAASPDWEVDSTVSELLFFALVEPPERGLTGIDPKTEANSKISFNDGLIRKASVPDGPREER